MRESNIEEQTVLVGSKIAFLATLLLAFSMLFRACVPAAQATPVAQAEVAQVTRAAR
jgi:hypothetical protein